MARRRHDRQELTPEQQHYLLQRINHVWYRVCVPKLLRLRLPIDLQRQLIIDEGLMDLWKKLYDEDPQLADRWLRNHGMVSIPAPEFGDGIVTLKFKGTLTGPEMKTKRERSKASTNIYAATTKKERHAVLRLTGEQLPLLFVGERASNGTEGP